MFESLLSIIITLAKGNLIVIGLLVAIFIIEKLTGLKLNIYQYFYWTKNKKNADTITYSDIMTYKIILIIVVIYDMVYSSLPVNFYTIIVAILYIFPFTDFVLLKIHRKYQKVDPSKDDNDFS